MTTSAPYAGTKVLTVGGSRNIGYLASVRLLEKGATVTFLLRSGPAAFDKDNIIQKYVKSGKARLVKGDALNKEDVAKAWEEAAKGEGWIRSLINVLSTLPANFTPPQIITISTTGLTKSSHSSLPRPLKPLYTYALSQPHRDKEGAERVIAYCAGWSWEDGKFKDDIFGKGDEWKEGLPMPGTLSSVVVIRPPLFTDGECKADKSTVKGKGKGKEPYRVKEGNISGYTISRKDVAHFMVEGVLADWQKWAGKCVGIAY